MHFFFLAQSSVPNEYSHTHTESYQALHLHLILCNVCPYASVLFAFRKVTLLTISVSPALPIAKILKLLWEPKTKNKNTNKPKMLFSNDKS